MGGNDWAIAADGLLLVCSCISMSIPSLRYGSLKVWLLAAFLTQSGFPARQVTAVIVVTKAAGYLSLPNSHYAVPGFSKVPDH